MLETPKPSIDGPIAGMGMTSELGSRPWQSPPEYATVEEALDYYIPKFSNSEIYDLSLIHI